MRRHLILLILIIFFTTGCSRSTPVPLAAEEIIQKASQRMKSLKGFHFVIDRTGSPAYLDPDHTYSFRRAEGNFNAPDHASASVRIIAPGLVAEIQIIGLGELYWETNILTGEWMALPPEQGFNPAVLFDPEIGIQPIIESDMIDLSLAGNEELEELPGKQLYAVAGKLKGERIYPMSYGLIGPDLMDVKLWIDPETFDIHRIMITQSRADDEPTIWQLDFWDFDKTLDITPPQTGS